MIFPTVCGQEPVGSEGAILYGEFLSFYDTDLRVVLDSHRRAVSNEVESQSDDYLLNVNRTEYIDYLVENNSVQHLTLHDDQMTVSPLERLIHAEEHPNQFFVGRGESYKRQVLRFEIPFSGHGSHFRYTPSTRTMSPPRIILDDDSVCFEIINFTSDSEKIRAQSETMVRDIKQYIDWQKTDIDGFNSKLRAHAEQCFDRRKEQVLAKNDLVASLGVPVKKVAGVSGTFSVPAKRTPTITAKSKPEVHEAGYKPEPTIDDKIYNDILKIIGDTGAMFERLPATYAGKDEEALRDHMIMMLEPNFEGSATGETFNKKGKTDILMRHESSNVFVAELKFWKGRKEFLETITQLLGYLTWRDSKAAVVIFVRNKDFSSVLEKAQEAAPEHDNYLGDLPSPDEGVYNYRFHIDGDENREVKIAVMLFHLCEEES